MKGISEILSITIVTLIVLTVFSGFFYWYSSIEEKSLVGSADYSVEIQNQVITRTNKVIDDFYNVAKEKNVNNYGELTFTIESDDSQIDISCEDSSVQIYEGYGSNTELVCSHYNLDCNCVDEQRYIYGVLENHAGTTSQTLNILTSSDFVSFSEKPITIQGTTAGGTKGEVLSNFDITYFDSFVEGGNSCKEPQNLLLLGYGSNPGESYGQVSIILNSDLEGSFYDKFNSEGVSAGQIAKYYDTVFVDDILEKNYDGGRSYDTILHQYHAFGGVLTDYQDDSDYQKQFLGSGKRVFSSSQGVGLYNLFTYFNTFFPSDQTDLAVSNLEMLTMKNHPAILMGTKDEQTDYTIGGLPGSYPTNVFDAYLAISKDYEVIPLIQGYFWSYIDPITYPDEANPICPYDLVSFRDQCGYSESDILNCDVKFNSVETMVADSDFYLSATDSEGTIFMGVNNVKVGNLRNDFEIFYTSTTSVSGDNTVYCLDTHPNLQIPPSPPSGHRVWDTSPIDITGFYPETHFEVVDMKETNDFDRIYTLVRNKDGDKDPWIIVYDGSETKYIELSQHDPAFGGSGSTKQADSLAVRYSEDKFYIYIGGKEDTSPHDTAFLYEIMTDISNNVLSTNYVYSDSNYASVSKLVILDMCAKSEPYFENGCGETLNRKERLNIVLNIEDTDCDISDYSSETIFTSELNIGKNRFYEIFKKENDPSAETDATIIS